MNRLLPALAASLALLLPALAQSPPVPTEPIRQATGPIRVNGMAAKANGEVITMNELMIKVAPLQSVLMARFPRRGAAFESQLADLRDQILSDLIDRAIIFSQFKDRISAIPDQQVEEEIERIIQNTYAGDKKKFRDYLRATNLSRAQFKEQQRKEILVQIIRSQHFGEVPPPPEKELRQEYAKWSLINRDRRQDVGTYQRIYLFKNRNGGAEAQLQLAEKLAADLKAGGDFSTAARQYSDLKADTGGLYKDIPRTDLNHEFGAILFETEGNDVIGPFEDPAGFNIIQVIERKYGPSKPFSEVKDQMQRRVISQKKQANFETWMKKQRDKAMIKKMI